MKCFLILLVAIVGCGGQTPTKIHQDVDSGVIDEATTHDDVEAGPAIDATEENGSLWSNCPGPQSGCGNEWCWPNCGVPGQGSGGTFGHQPM